MDTNQLTRQQETQENIANNCQCCADGVVQFDPVHFSILYPQFAELDNSTLMQYFRMAEMILDNSPNSPVKDLNKRETLYFLLVCHIATLSSRGDGLVGMITNATEGKVSVSVAALANANWFNQTACGSMYWQATMPYRMGVRYIAYRKR